ncbi:MAG TPA: carboxypeptidase-like regulatory domain-containing protein [Kofleriaceae bacterium]|nr:carboxypeptidase-like regulatory domain-containing protein [Kofleriaceae bacterium]
MYTAVMFLGACDHHGGGQEASDAAAPPDACEGLGCSIVDCSAKSLPSTTVSGTVYAPNGTLPLYGVTVYVPIHDPGPLPAGVTCGNCASSVPGGAYTQAITDEAGRFTLSGVPAASDVPLVIQVGKWRRQLTVPSVAACQDTALPTVSTTLPRNRSEGDLPQIAITTGDADALDCLVRKLGVDDAEITTDAQGGKVHLYYGNGAKQFASGFTGGSGSFSNATTLWGNLDKLSGYDIVAFSCEGGQHPETKSQDALQAVHDYAGRGGRVFLSHWHNIWIGGDRNNPDHSLADWKSIATFDFAAAQNESTQHAFVDETAPKGAAFATWLENVGATPTRDQLEISDPRYTCQSVTARAERWVYVDPDRSEPLGKTGVQDMLFTTPQDEEPAQRCGKVVFSDMHVSADSSSKSGTAYPGGCSKQPLTAQEKALAFIFFDISSCVGILQ